MFLFFIISVRILQLGGLTATSLGLDIKRASFILFFIMSGAVAVSVMFGGTFPFIGFTSAHIMRYFYGSNFKLHFISSILCAAVIIILSDIVAHQMFSTILPTNIFLGLFGGTGFPNNFIAKEGKRMAISVKNLSFGYEKKSIIKNVSFSLEKGKFISLIGPNGSGKSTLLKTMLYLQQPQKGKQE